MKTVALAPEPLKSQAKLLKVPSRVLSGTNSTLHWWPNSSLESGLFRGVVWFIHGMGEHMARYEEFALFLNNFGYDFVGIDLPGHGLSKKTGNQYRLLSFQKYLLEIENALEYWCTEGPRKESQKTKEIYLMGHSMGALLALNWLVKDRSSYLQKLEKFPAKCIVSAPPVKLRVPVPAWKDYIASKLRNTLPYIKINNELNPEMLSHDSVIVSRFYKDPLRHSKASPALYGSLLESIEEVKEGLQNIEVPLLIMGGAQDPIVECFAFEAYFQTLGTHKKLCVFPHMKHEILNEINRESVYKEVLKWLTL